MPAAWKPVKVEGDITDLTQVTEFGGLQPTATLLKNDSYTVESRVPVWSPELLRNTGDDYPGYVEELYLQIPESTPERLEEFTSNLTANATTAYDKAVTIERWLEANKKYSLKVNRPPKNIAYNFVFNMNKGYCVYYATAMVTMLRSQGIPARFVVGYATGQQVDNNEWVIRGLDSHAWVEVYFEDVGWVRFDPTPAQSRLAVEQSTLQDAREQGMENVDTSESSPENNPQTNQPGQSNTQTNTPPGSATANQNGTPAGLVSGAQGLGGNGTLANITSGLQSGNGTGSGGFMGVTPQTVGLSLLTLLGVGAVAHRTGYAEKGYREARLRWQRRTDDPERDVERAFERLEYVLEKNYRPRRPGETPREYFSWMYEGKMGIDKRIERVFDIHEKSHYSPESVTQEEADEAVELVDKIVKDYNKFLN
ncbi:MAG: transglutaminase domain-containing protein [Halobacteria archaeon]|nr:transglutaminase domain-containing protein [Halobacteria archaeon]